MRTTLTLDDDVAAELERLRRGRDQSLKDIVNDTLRRGLKDLRRPARKRRAFRTKTFDLGEPLISIDNAAEATAYAEGDAFK